MLSLYILNLSGESMILFIEFPLLQSRLPKLLPKYTLDLVVQFTVRWSDYVRESLHIRTANPKDRHTHTYPEKKVGHDVTFLGRGGVLHTCNSVLLVIQSLAFPESQLAQ